MDYNFSSSAMDGEQNSRTRKFQRWFTRKQKRAKPFYTNEGSDEGEENDSMHGVIIRSLEMDPCSSTDELRVFVGTWNVGGRSPIGSLAVDLDDWLNLKDAADIYVLGFQEIVPIKATTVIGAEDQREATNWNLLIGKTLNDKYGCPWLTPMIYPITEENYLYEEAAITERKLRASNRKGNSIRSSVRVCSVPCGIMGYLGNKGSISVSMSINGTSFCFVAAHLASGEKKGAEGRRNHQVSEIFRRTSFPRLPEDGSNSHPLAILGHDRIFWFGDLNYRLYLEDSLARQLIKKQDWRALQKFDQLGKELEDGGVFQGWKEGNIEFAPTYKYSSSFCNRYSGGIPSRAGEKPRTPAWCDRILWYGNGVRQLSYFRSESKFSDHRPVSALFSTKLEERKSTNPGFTARNFLPDNLSIAGQEGADEEDTSTLLSLIVKDMENSPSCMQKCIPSK